MLIKKQNVPALWKNVLLTILPSLLNAGKSINETANSILKSLLNLYTSFLRCLFNVVSKGSWGSVLGIFMIGGLWVVALAQSIAFSKAITAKRKKLLQVTDDEGCVKFSYAQLAGLPAPVQRYFRYALNEGQHFVKYASLRQEGHFRIRVGPGMKSGENWKPVRSEEFVCISNPGFVWSASISLAPFVWMRGWDLFVENEAHMLWKLFSSLNLVDFRGPELEQSALLRFLSEAVFYPTALIPRAKGKGSYSVTWDPVGADSAQVTLKHHGRTAVAVFHFNAIGQVTHVKNIERPRALDDGSHSPDRWTGVFGNYKEMMGIRMPTQMEAIWNLSQGDFAYATLNTLSAHSWCGLDGRCKE